MKHMLRIHLLLVITALILLPKDLSTPWLDALNLNPTTPYSTDMLILWAEASLAIGVLALFITIMTPLLSKFFLGYVSKKPDEGSEVYFYVVLTLFIFSLCLSAERQLSPPERDVEKDTQFLCELLNENLEFSSKDGTKQEVEAICGTDKEDAEQKKK